MEYKIYIETRYFYSGRFEARAMTAERAERLGYEDGFETHTPECRIFVDGYDTVTGAAGYVSSLIGNALAEYTVQYRVKGKPETMIGRARGNDLDDAKNDFMGWHFEEDIEEIVCIELYKEGRKG